MRDEMHMHCDEVHTKSLIWARDSLPEQRNYSQHRDVRIFSVEACKPGASGMPVVHSGHVAKTSTRIKNRISDERHCFESGIHPRRSFEGSSKLLLKSARLKLHVRK